MAYNHYNQLWINVLTCVVFIQCKNIVDKYTILKSMLLGFQSNEKLGKESDISMIRQNDN